VGDAYAWHAIDWAAGAGSVRVVCAPARPKSLSLARHRPPLFVWCTIPHQDAPPSRHAQACPFV